MIGLKVSVLLFLFVNFEVNGQFPLPRGKCNDLCPGIDLKTVDLHALNGFWNRYASIPFSWQKKYECGYVDFYAITKSVAELHETSRIDGILNEFIMNVFVRPDGDESVLIRKLKIIYRQRVIYADSNVVLILTCLPNALNGNGRGIYGWIASTSWDTTEAMAEPALKALEKCGIPREAMIRQNNTGCAASYQIIEKI